MHATRVAALLCILSGAALAQTTQEDAPVTEGRPAFTPPTLTRRVQADYPPEALKLGLQGTVVLDIDLDEHGQVTGVTVKQGAGHGFDEAALAAARRFEFTPALNDRTPVPSRVTFAYKFALKTAPAPAPPKQEPVRLRGAAVLRGTRSPLAGGRIIAVGPSPETASTGADLDEQGRFELRLRPGRYHLVVNGPKARRFEADETLGNEVVTVKYYVEPSQYSRYESTVKSDLNREEISRQTLTTEELTKLPGTFGDALRAIENLPGVARAPFNSGLIIVRGGKPTDSRVFLGASEVPQLYHFGGLTSIVPAQLVERVDYFPGNFGVRYGRASAGAIDVELREGRRDRWHASLDVNVFDAGASVEGPVGKGSVFLAARRSYADAVLGLVDAPGLKFVSAPVYYDYQGILDQPLGGGKLRVMLLGSDDVLKLVFDQPQDADPALTDFGTHIFFHKAQVRYTKALGAGWSLLAQVTGGYQGQQGALGRDLSYDIGVGQVDSRIEARWQASKQLKLLLGVDALYAHVTLNADVPEPTREGQIPSPISAGEKLHSRSITNLGELGLYAELNWKPSSRFTLTPGLRVDWYSALPHPSFDPRVSSRLQLAKYTTLKAGLGLYSQPPAATDYDPTFGNPKLRPEKAIHSALTVEQGVLPGLQVELTGFYKHLYDLSAVSSLYTQRDGAPAPNRVDSIGEGRVFGMELLLRQSVSKWLFGWVSYTLMRSERKDCDSCGWRLFDFDQTHVLIVAVHAYLPKGFEVGARFRYISGLPYSLVAGGYYDADSDVYSPAKYPVNNSRLDDYHSLDLRFDKTFLFRKWVLKVYLDLTNVYNHANPETVATSYDYTRRVVVSGLPFLPSFGIRGEF